MTERVLVTGANSLLGVNAIHELLAAGYAVRGLLRKKALFVGMQHPALELVEGDFTAPTTLRNAMDGCRYVVHCAAKTAQHGPYNSFRWVNVTATEQLIRNAIEHKIERIVHVGSANIFAYGDAERPGDETRPICAPFTASAYAKSKSEAQQRINTYLSQIEIVTACPTFMVGAYDSRPSSGRIVLTGYGKRLLFYPPGGKNFVHVADVAHGIVAALRYGKNEECYLLANENLSYRDFFRMVAARSSRRTRMVRLPRWLLLTVGALGDCAAWLGFRSEISTANMRILCVKNYYSNAKSINELGMSYVPVGQAVDDAVGWFRFRKLLPDK